MLILFIILFFLVHALLYLNINTYVLGTCNGNVSATYNVCF